VVTRDIIGGGDGSKLAFVGTVRWGAITPYTLRINVTIGGTAYPIDDDGASGMTDGGAGVLDPAGTNSVDYATGIINLTFAAGSAPDALTFLSSNYCQDATRGTSQDEDMAGGTDGVVPLSRAQVSHPTLEATNKGMYALNVPDEMMQVGVPDFAGDTTLAGDQLDWAGRVKDKFIILATPYGMTPTQAKDYKRFTLNRNDTYGALYYPWVGLTDPVTNSQVFQPPIGHLAGVMARTDNNRTVSKAPAGVEDGKLAFTTSLEYKMSLVEIGVLNPIGVNCLFESEFTGRCVWGARTLGVNTDFRYIQARRFFIFNEKSVYRSMWGFVFETVGGMLFDRIQTAIEGFESGLLALGGYFPSGNPGLSYRVICDTSNNTDATLALGIVICDIYLATTVPGEFIWFRYQQLVTTA
jgi:phage tail sheath protein FI